MGTLGIGELSDGLVVRLVPPPIVLDDDPNPVDGLVVPSGDERLDVLGVLDELGDRLGENGVTLDVEAPAELVVGDVAMDDVAIDDVPTLVVAELRPVLNVPDVEEVEVRVEVGAPIVVVESVGSQGACGVGAAVGPGVEPVCIVADG